VQASRSVAPVPRSARLPKRQRGSAVACAAESPPTEPFSTEPGFSKSFTASFEKRSTTAPPDKPALAPEELGEVQLETEVR
jgi:hypothetical protein